MQLENLRIRWLLAVTAAASAALVVLAVSRGTAFEAVEPVERVERTSESPVQPESPAVKPVRPRLEVVAKAKHRQSPVSEPLPITFTIVNRSDREQVVLSSLDGSDAGWRYPKITIEIRNFSGELVELDATGRCKLVNPLKVEDFVKLAPGQSLELFGEGSFGHHALAWKPSVPGRYSVRLRYDLSFAGTDRATHDEAARTLVDALPREIYESQPIEIEVTGF